MSTRRLAAIALIAGLVAAGCTGADQANPPGDATTATTGTTRHTRTTKGPATTRVPNTYPPVSGPDMVGSASTVPSNDAELKIPELNDAPTLIDMPCQLEHQYDGYTQQLSVFTETPPEPTNLKGGTQLTYRGKPVSFHVEYFAPSAELEDDWIIATSGGNEYVLASIDPASAQVKGDTYRLTGCQIRNISRSSNGDTWISVCLQEGSRFRGTAVRLDPAGVSFNEIVGLHTICPEVIATPQYTWLIGPGIYDESQSKRLRLWRLDPASGEWLTVDLLDTADNRLSMAYSGGVLWRRANAKSFCITQAPPESQGPTGVDFESLDVTGASRFGGLRNGQMWATAEHHRLVAFDCDGNKIADFALNDPSSVSVGESGIIVQRPSRRENPDIIPTDANIIISRINPTTGQSTDLLTAPAPVIPRGPNELVGRPFGITLDQTGGWITDMSTAIRIPPVWFTAN